MDDGKQSASILQVRTLYLRNVPDDVAEGLEQLATRHGMSVNVFAVRELSQVARRARNADLFASLPDLGIDRGSILADLDAGRAER
ncbi:MAG: hypothetical protein REI11_06505 [Patulibacter sp.]|nr:hypothetical protein [Patulibacter sp.]